MSNLLEKFLESKEFGSQVVSSTRWLGQGHILWLNSVSGYCFHVCSWPDTERSPNAEF
jgi:hypothetical protein